MRNKSFTLIELLVVIAIIGLIASIFLAGMKGVREKARIAGGLEFSHSIQHTLGAYAVGIWEFKEGEPGTCPDGKDICDSSGHENHGTNNGAIWTTDTPSGQNYALYFDENDNVDCGTSETLDLQSALTIEAWVKPDSLSETHQNAIVDRNTGYWFFISTAKKLAFLRFKDGLYDTVTTDANIPTGTWTHVVVAYDSFALNEVKFYINGQLSKEVSLDGPIDSSDSALQIGNRGGLHPFNGGIDEVKIYSQALSATQIQQNYVQGVTRQGTVLR